MSRASNLVDSDHNSLTIAISKRLPCCRQATFGALGCGPCITVFQSETLTCKSMLLTEYMLGTQSLSSQSVPYINYFLYFQRFFCSCSQYDVSYYTLPRISLCNCFSPELYKSFKGQRWRRPFHSPHSSG